MLLDWIRIDLKLVVDSPLAIGTGRLLVGDGSDIAGVAAVQLGADGNPCIPATSLKGALRSAIPIGDLRSRSFGDIGRSDGSGISGRLLLGQAAWDEVSSNLKDEVVSSRSAKTFDRPATSIDRTTGSAAKGKLFTQRAVKRGAVFKLSGRYQCDLSNDGWEATLKQDTIDLGKVLAPLFYGLALGKGTRLGYGRIRLSGEDAVFRLYRCDPKSGHGDGVDISESVLAAVREAAEASDFQPLATLTIRGVSPFLIVDPARRRYQAAEGQYREVTVPVRSGDGLAMLWPSSLLGVLRARASWIAEIDRLRSANAGRSPKFVPVKRDPDHAADDRFLEVVLGPNRRAVETPGDFSLLSSVERLFGVPGWKGGIVISSLKCISEGAKRVVTNVAIDRLTGGAKDGALFTTEAVEGAEFTFGLDMDYGSRGVPDNLRLVDEELLKSLIAALKQDGLVLGHAASRGFGRFCVTGGFAA